MIKNRQISAIEVQARRRDRVNVYLDGSFGFSLALMVAQDAGLRPGLEMDDGSIAALRDRDGKARAYDSALNFLSFRPRSESEVRLNLKRKGIDPDLIEETIARLHKTGLLDDAAFARFWVENRDNFSPRGERALKAELRQRGVGDEVVEEALSSDERDETAAARLAAAKKARSLHGLEYRTFRDRLSGYLARRGFNYDTIKEVVAEVWGEVGGDDTEEDDD